MFGRKGRRTPLQKEALEHLELLRDDCIAIFVDSGLTQKEVHERGGPTPSTISKWLYRETFFPRYDTVERFLLALGYGLTPMPLVNIQERNAKFKAHQRLNLDVPMIGRPRMPRRASK